MFHKGQIVKLTGAGLTRFTVRRINRKSITIEAEETRRDLFPGTIRVRPGQISPETHAGGIAPQYRTPEETL
jgi:hypothetical protein